MTICLATEVKQKHSTRLPFHWGTTANANISSTSNLNFSNDAPTPKFEKFMYDLTLQSTDPSGSAV
jgi:hypothetical protein